MDNSNTEEEQEQQQQQQQQSANGSIDWSGAEKQIMASYQMTDAETNEALQILRSALQSNKFSETYPERLRLISSKGYPLFIVKTQGGLPQTIDYSSPNKDLRSPCGFRSGPSACGCVALVLSMTIIPTCFFIAGVITHSG
jgi:hypothetical protein